MHIVNKKVSKKVTMVATLRKMQYAVSAMLLFLSCSSEKKIDSRVVEDFNFNWQFYLEDSTRQTKDTLWKDVRLPHDWSVEHSFTQENASGATAFLPGGIGWYRKSFNMPEEAPNNQVTWIEFDGVYNNAEVWINGHYLGKRPYGYSPFSYNLTKYLKYGQENTITVKADRSAYIDNRWYPGSGIYRNVKLVTANKIHIPQWGTFVTTPDVSETNATVSIQTEIVNETENSSSAILKTTIQFKEKEITTTEKILDLKVGLNAINQVVEVSNPNLWNTVNPNMYTAVSKVIVDDQVVDMYETAFGIRTFHFDSDKGFFLNGKNTLIKGVCLHHDGGLVGAAVPDGVWIRRLQTLKDAGCNAIRTAHNPPSAAFLDICDQMGFLVQDEAFDEWNNPKDKKHNYSQQEANPLTTGYTEHFTEWSERDIKSMVRRDRNHPSIIMWSIGNEIEWTYPGYETATGYWGENKKQGLNYYWDEPPFSIEKMKKNFETADKGEYDLATTAKNLSKWVKEIDTTRPVTANLVIPSVSYFSGYTDALDIVGLSYRQSVYDYVKENYSEKVILGTENWTQYHEWKPVIEKDFISGIFLWTGINYMGESREWPIRGSGSGLLDFAGFKKPSYHMFKTLWNDEPHIFITTQLLEKSPYKLNQQSNQLVEKEEDWAKTKKWGWHDVQEHWNYKEGKEIAVEVYTNQPEVELFLNNTSLGVQKLVDHDDHILKWLVPYKKGKLTAKSVGTSSLEATLQTTSEFAKLALSVDKDRLIADAYDIAHFKIQLQDKNGNAIKNENHKVTFEIEGDARLLGVDNGSVDNVQNYQSKSITTYNGKALMILQSNKTSGEVMVKAYSGNMVSNVIRIAVQ